MSKKNAPILLADPSPKVVEAFREVLQSFDHDLIVAEDGHQCLELWKSQRPALVIADLTLPKKHGIELLKTIRADEEKKETGVIISTQRALVQDYQAAMRYGVDYYLTKPFDKHRLELIISRFFAGTLLPAPFQMLPDHLSEESYKCPIPQLTRYMKSWGTRGSIPISNPSCLRHGGNTVCLEIRDGNSVIILDAGSGIRELGEELLRRGTREIHLVIGHSHWDHVMGFPFFVPVYDPKCKIHIYAARGFYKNVRDIFRVMLDHDYFPVRLDEMHAEFHFIDISDGTPIQAGDLVVHSTYTTHPGATLGFRIEANGKRVGYVTDNEFLLGYQGDPKAIHRDHELLAPYLPFVDFLSGCDLLIHEAQYLPEEYRAKIGWGHSSVANAAVLAKLTKTPEWVVTHHDPCHTDELLNKKLEYHRKVLQDLEASCRVSMGYDGWTLPL